VKVHRDGSWPIEAAESLLARLRERPQMRLCLATGSTPLPMYSRLAQHPDAFAAASVLLLDEFGGLPADEPASCDATLRRVLIHHVRPADYRAIATDHLGEPAAVDAWIDAGRLDLVVLGIGVNGHLGMNEPGAPAEGRTARVDLEPTTIEGAQRYFEGRVRPTWGVTVGLGDLLAAGEVWVLAAGESKVDIVRRSTEGPATTAVPASLLQHHPDVTWWLDR